MSAADAGDLGREAERCRSRRRPLGSVPRAGSVLAALHSSSPRGLHAFQRALGRRAAPAHSASTSLATAHCKGLMAGQRRWLRARPHRASVALPGWHRLSRGSPCAPSGRSSRTGSLQRRDVSGCRCIAHGRLVAPAEPRPAGRERAGAPTGGGLSSSQGRRGCMKAPRLALKLQLLFQAFNCEIFCVRFVRIIMGQKMVIK